jgi:hypothetical protein
MNKADIIALIESITPESSEEDVKAAYAQLTDTKGIKKVYILNAAQRQFNLTTLTGVTVLGSFERDDLARVTLAARHGIFDFGHLVHARKTPDGKEEGSYTWPEPALVMEAVTAAYEGRYNDIDLAAMLPRPEDVGGKVPTVPFKAVCPKSAGASGASRKAVREAPTPSDAETPAIVRPDPTPKPSKKTATTQEVPVTAPSPAFDFSTLAPEVAAAVADLVVPGIQRCFSVLGRALHAQAHVMTVLLTRQDNLAERIELVGSCILPDFEVDEMPEAPVDALQVIISAARTLMGDIEDLDQAMPRVDVQEKEEEEEPVAPVVKKTAAPPVEQKAAAQPEVKKPEVKKAAGAGQYSTADLEAIDEGQLDLTRVDFSDDKLRAEYPVSILKKIIVAFGEVPGAPTRGMLVNRVLALAKREGLLTE